MYRVTWTDEPMDDFAAYTGRRFDEVSRRFDRLDGDIHRLRAEMNTRFGTLQRMMLQGSVGVIVALIGLIATQL